MSAHLPVPVANTRHTIFSSRRKAAFLTQLAESGNVRLACKSASVSPQTAYRARRQSPAFAQAWDAALLAARPIAEQVLADRALNGTEEAVFYHGEEVARRTRYDSRLLLAHLARLDRLAERIDPDAVSALDDQIEELESGEDLEPDILHQDTVPGVPSCRNSQSSNSEAVGQTKTPSNSEAVGQEYDSEFARKYPLEMRLRAMERARPRGAPEPHELETGDVEAWSVEAVQLEAFEAGEENWWEKVE